MTKRIKLKFERNAYLRVDVRDFYKDLHYLNSEFVGVEFGVRVPRDDPFLREFSTDRTMNYFRRESEGLRVEGMMNSSQAIVTLSFEFRAGMDDQVESVVGLLDRLEEAELKEILLKCYPLKGTAYELSEV